MNFSVDSKVDRKYVADYNSNTILTLTLTFIKCFYDQDNTLKTLFSPCTTSSLINSRQQILNLFGTDNVTLFSFCYNFPKTSKEVVNIELLNLCCTA